MRSEQRFRQERREVDHDFAQQRTNGSQSCFELLCERCFSRYQGAAVQRWHAERAQYCNEQSIVSHDIIDRVTRNKPESTAELAVW